MERTLLLLLANVFMAKGYFEDRNCKIYIDVSIFKNLYCMQFDQFLLRITINYSHPQRKPWLSKLTYFPRAIHIEVAVLR